MDDMYPPPKELPPGSSVWAYLRDSGGMSQELSVSQQKEKVKEYCKRHGLILVMLFADEAKSAGSTVGRDAFSDMMAMTTDPDNRPDGILIWNYARFARDMDDSSYFEIKLRKFRGIVVFSLTDLIIDGPIGKLMKTLIDFSNEEKRHQNSRDVKRALQSLVRQGYSCGGNPPRGYISEKVVISTKRDGSPRTVSKWVPDPDLRDLVELAWRLRSDGKTYGEIRDATGGRLYKTKNSFPTFFSNKTYLGIGKCGDLEVPDHHESLVDQETWDKVQEIQNGNPRRKNTGHRHHPTRVANPTLLSGLAVCALCGSAMTAQTSGRWPAYICGQKARRGKYSDCQSRLVGREKADNAITDMVMNRILTMDFFADLLKETRSQLENTSEMELKLTGFQKSLVETERGISNLLELAVTFGAQSAGAKIIELETEQARLKSEIKQLEDRTVAAQVEISPEALGLALNTWCNQIDKTQSTRELKNLIARFVSKIELGYNTARIWYEYPLALDRIPPPWGHFTINGQEAINIEWS